jgi:hypothetical protein
MDDSDALTLLRADICKLFPPGAKRERWLAWAAQLEDQPDTAWTARSPECQNPRRMDRRIAKALSEWIAPLPFIALGLSLLGGLVILGFESLYWLKMGSWPRWTLITRGYFPPFTELIGLNKIIVAVFDTDLAALVPLVDAGQNPRNSGGDRAFVISVLSS